MDKHNDLVNFYLEEFNTNLIPKCINTHHEVFDKHPITAMSDIDSNSSDRTIVIRDSWKPDWCRGGIQIPVNSLDEQKKPIVKKYSHNLPKRSFVMPDKLIRTTDNLELSEDRHVRVSMHTESDEPMYELDHVDLQWLRLANRVRRCMGHSQLSEHMFEVFFELAERWVYRELQTHIREAETEFLEHDENSRCDICQSPEGEDGNELVFCEDCFVCVHQACYGIPVLPAGNWICRHCEKCPNQSHRCVLCPNKGGAMKQLENEEDKWAHISCAVWIPELAFGNVDLMEPITKLAQIPAARWRLICHLCRQSSVGAPIQCSDKKCKLAFHVTCAVDHNLFMKQEFEEDMEVRNTAYCQNHTKAIRKGVEDNPKVSDGPRDIKELRIKIRRQWEPKLTQLFKVEHVKKPVYEHPPQLANHIQRIVIDNDKGAGCRLHCLFQLWRMKRASSMYMPLIHPVPASWGEQQQQQRLTNRAVLRSFRNIRFGLDRARLVLDMVVRREKKKTQLMKVMSEVSQYQMQFLRDCRANTVLKDDPSLSASWGLLSRAHLESDNMYVNPRGVGNPNLEFVLSSLQQQPLVDDGNKAVAAVTEPTANSKVAERLGDCLAEPALLGPMLEQQEGLTWSCVATIPDEQLRISDSTKVGLLQQLGRNTSSVFAASYLLMHEDKKENRTPASATQVAAAKTEVHIEDDDVIFITPSTDQLEQSAMFSKKRRISISRRHTDFVSPFTKRNLFDEIMKSSKTV